MPATKAKIETAQVASADKTATPETDAAHAVQVGLPSDANLPAWRASDDDWSHLADTQFRRGWQLVALSLGITPVLSLIRELPKPEAELYKQRLDVLVNSTTEMRSKNKLQYEYAISYQGSASAPKNPKYYSFDVVKFVDFFSRRPKNSTIHPSLIEAADAFRKLDAESGTRKKTPVRNENAGRSRIEASLLDMFHGLVIAHYPDYVPVGLAGGPREGGGQKVLYEQIATDILASGLHASAYMVTERLTAAVDQLRDVEELRTAVIAAIKKRK